MAFIIDTPEYHVISVNNFPFWREELWNPEKGIIRVYGKDFDKEKINHVKYPKSFYTREYIENNVLPRYNDCPLCRIGQDIGQESTSRTDKIKQSFKKNAKYIFPLSLGVVALIVGGTLWLKWKSNLLYEKDSTKS